MSSIICDNLNGRKVSLLKDLNDYLYDYASKEDETDKFSAYDYQTLGAIFKAFFPHGMPNNSSIVKSKGGKRGKKKDKYIIDTVIDDNEEVLIHFYPDYINDDKHIRMFYTKGYFLEFCQEHDYKIYPVNMEKLQSCHTYIYCTVIKSPRRENVIIFGDTKHDLGKKIKTIFSKNYNITKK